MSTLPPAPEVAPHAAWLADFFGAIDHLDAEGFAGHFEPTHGSFRFANHPAWVGQDLICQACGGIFSLLDHIRHECLKHWLVGQELLVEGQVHYRRLDGFELSVPFFSVFEFATSAPGPIQAYRVFVDSHELFSAPPAQ